MRNHISNHFDHDPDFRWRGTDVTRIENLSDIVFALALSMLLLTGSPPQTFGELVSFMRSIVPVAAGFLLFLLIWNEHFVFFRRYGLADGKVVFLNSVLLLIVMFLAYPLRFIFDSLFNFIIGLISGNYEPLVAIGMDFRNSGISVAIFNIGYAVIFLLFNLMYMHANSKADALGLDPKEIALTRQSIWIQRAQIVLAAIVAICALNTPAGPLSGGLLMFMWPVAYTIERLVQPEPTQSEDAIANG